jgi:hypothetical protein
VGGGTVRRLDEDAKRLATVRDGRAPESKKKPWTAPREAALASLRAVRPAVAVVALAAGAEAHGRSFARPTSEHATQIVDHGHASPPLRVARAADSGEKTVAGRAEDARRRLLLRDPPGGAADGSAARSRLSRQRGGKRRQRRRQRLNAARTSCQNQRDRLDAAGDQARGLPMGSGGGEAACKTRATQRVKRSGMSGRDGQHALLTMRRLPQRHRGTAAWALLSAHVRVEVIAVRTHGPLRELTPAKTAA